MLTESWRAISWRCLGFHPAARLAATPTRLHGVRTLTQTCSGQSDAGRPAPARPGPHSNPRGA